MRYLNIFSQNEIDNLTSQIYNCINSCADLTYRNKKEIRRNLVDGYIYCCFNDADLVGFIFCTPLISNWFELKSWYVKPDYRNKGIGLTLLSMPVKNSSSYLLTTFNSKLASVINAHSFDFASLNTIPKLVLLKYVFTRDIRKIGKHLFSTKSILLVRQ